jgi:hypothetical protein
MIFIHISFILVARYSRVAPVAHILLFSLTIHTPRMSGAQMYLCICN